MAGVDTLVLGCTHYPLLTGVISYVMGNGVTLVSAAPRKPPRTSIRTLMQVGGLRGESTDAAGAPLHGDRRPGAVRAARPRFLGPEIVEVDQVLACG